MLALKPVMRPIFFCNLDLTVSLSMTDISGYTESTFQNTKDQKERGNAACSTLTFTNLCSCHVNE